jgi:hypothetical protein
MLETDEIDEIPEVRPGFTHVFSAAGCHFMRPPERPVGSWNVLFASVAIEDKRNGRTSSQSHRVPRNQLQVIGKILESFDQTKHIRLPSCETKETAYSQAATGRVHLSHC